MPRDYKHRASSGRRRSAAAARPPRQPLGILPFLSGLSVGLFVAFVIYLHEHDADRPAGSTGETLSSTTQTKPAKAREAATKTSKPHFDFYTILPEREVKVPEWEVADHREKDTSDIPATSYLLQVGSFQRYQDADRVKARLALLGIKAGIQRVVINGQDVWFRVRIGPFKDLHVLNDTRAKLASNGMNAMLLRIKPDAE